MILKNFDLINLYQQLNFYSEKKMPQQIGYAIAKNIIILDTEYQIYKKQLQKILNEYNEYIEKDKNGKMVILENGMPKLKDKKKQPIMYQDVEELLNIEINVDFYQIPEQSFNYNDERYDILTVKEILFLQSIMCNKNLTN